MSRKEDGHLLCFYASLTSSVCWGPHYSRDAVGCRVCASHCRIRIPLHTKSLISVFLVPTVLSSLTYNSKGCCLFVNFCTLWLFSPDLFFLLLFPFFQATLKISTLSPPIFPFPSLKCIVTLKKKIVFSEPPHQFSFFFRYFFICLLKVQDVCVCVCRDIYMYIYSGTDCNTTMACT